MKPDRALVAAPWKTSEPLTLPARPLLWIARQPHRVPVIAHICVAPPAARAGGRELERATPSIAPPVFVVRSSLSLGVTPPAWGFSGPLRPLLAGPEDGHLRGAHIHPELSERLQALLLCVGRLGDGRAHQWSRQFGWRCAIGIAYCQEGRRLGRLSPRRLLVAAPRAEFTIEIQAPIERVWQVMLDMNAYAEWNPFIVKVEGVAPGRQVAA